MTAPSDSIGLVLSGGGFRATLFHLGVVQHLSETGDLKRVTHICSVSGGSILAAHLVLNWEDYVASDSPSRFEQVSHPILAFVRRDVRGRIVRRFIAAQIALLPALCRLIARFRFLSFLEPLVEIGTLRQLLQHEYNRLFRGRRLADLDTPTAKIGAPRPDLHLLSMSLTTGVLTSFSRRGFWLDEKPEPREIPTERLPISLAVTASSAFPPLFPPVRVDNDVLTVRRDELPYTHYLADGGVYDNLGIHRLKRLEEQQNLTFSTVVVSDAGARSDWVTDDPFTSILTRNIRATDLLMSRVSNLDHAALRHGYWPNVIIVSLHDLVTRAEEPDALPPETQRSLATVRTDLDKFSDKEVGFLIHHGKIVAKYRLRTFLTGEHAVIDANAVRPEAKGTALVSRWPSVEDVSPLRDAYRVRMRSLSLRDWSSWLSVVLLVVYIYVFVMYVGEPFLGRQRFQQYSQARTAAGDIWRAKHAQAARERLESLEVRLFWPLDSHWSSAALAVFVEAAAIRREKRAIRMLIDKWNETGERPVDLDDAILRVARAYGVSWQRESGQDAQKLYRDLRVVLFQRAAEVTTSIAFYSNLGAWGSTSQDREAFWALYWGDLGIVEGPRVEAAMVEFGRLLPRADESGPEPPGDKLLQAAARLAAATNAELGVGSAKGGSPRSFSLLSNGQIGALLLGRASGREVLGRWNWLLVRDGLWTARPPDGYYLFLPIKERRVEAGCAGTVVYVLQNRATEFFVPDKGCEKMSILVHVETLTGDKFVAAADMEEIL